MFFKTALFSFLFIASTARLAIAAPPACVLACVNNQPEVQDFKAVCGAKAAEVAQCLSDACNKDVYQAAVDDFKGQCKDAGVTVVIPTTTLATKTSMSTATNTYGNSKTSSTSTSATSTSVHNTAGQTTVNTMVALAAVLAGIIAM